MEAALPALVTGDFAKEMQRFIATPAHANRFSNPGYAVFGDEPAYQNEKSFGTDQRVGTDDQADVEVDQNRDKSVLNCHAHVPGYLLLIK